MGRLYAWLKSDTNLTEKTISGNETIEAQVNYGSKDKSLYTAEIIVTWHKGEEKPSVRFLISSGIKYEVNHVN